MKSAILTAILLCAMASQASAQLNFDFSFSNNDGGNTDGTITGEINGLLDNTTNQAATSVVIDTGSIPAAYDFPSIDNTATSSPWTIDTNIFAVENGQITAGDFDAQFGSDSPASPTYTLFLEFGDVSELFENNSQEITDTVSSSPNFSEAGGSSSSTPEPATLGMLGIAMVGLGALKFRHKQ